MAEANRDLGRFVLSAPMRQVFEHLFEAKPFKNGKGEPKFDNCVAFPETHVDFKDMKATAVAVARAAWPGTDLALVQWPFKRGDEFIAKKAQEGKPVKDPETFAGLIMLTARSKNQPRLSGFEGGKIVDYDDPAVIASKKSKFYRGVDVLCEYFFAANEVNGSKVVSAYLNKVMTTGKGERLSSQSSGASTFSGYVGGHTAVDPNAGLDDEIPF